MYCTVYITVGYYYNTGEYIIWKENIFSREYMCLYFSSFGKTWLIAWHASHLQGFQ